MNDLLLPASLSYLSKVSVLLLENFIFLWKWRHILWLCIDGFPSRCTKRVRVWPQTSTAVLSTLLHTFFPSQQHIHQICSWLTVMVVISGDNESTQRLSQWFKDNNLVPKMSRTRDRTMDFTVIKHVIISRNCVEKVTDVQFLGFYNNKSLNVWLRRQSRDLTSAGSSWRILSPETLYFFFCSFFSDCLELWLLAGAKNRIIIIIIINSTRDFHQMKTPSRGDLSRSKCIRALGVLLPFLFPC